MAREDRLQRRRDRNTERFDKRSTTGGVDTGLKSQSPVVDSGRTFLNPNREIRTDLLSQDDLDNKFLGFIDRAFVTKEEAAEARAKQGLIDLGFDKSGVVEKNNIGFNTGQGFLTDVENRLLNLRRGSATELAQNQLGNSQNQLKAMLDSINRRENVGLQQLEQDRFASERAQRINQLNRGAASSGLDALSQIQQQLAQGQSVNQLIQSSNQAEDAARRANLNQANQATTALRNTLRDAKASEITQKEANRQTLIGLNREIDNILANEDLSASEALNQILAIAGNAGEQFNIDPSKLT